MIKYDLPDLYVSEASEYRRIKELGSARSNAGNVSFTSSSSNTTYSSTNGQFGVMQQLENLLTQYKINATDWNGIEEGFILHKIDYLQHKNNKTIHGATNENTGKQYTIHMDDEGLYLREV